ncbi:MAG: 3-deoxy-D-manno-octulosonic acid transferase [Pseudomonadota bacterium]
MNEFLLRFYSWLMWLGQPLLRNKLARRARGEAGYGQAVEERFGHYSQPAETVPALVWLHAVSLGEARTAGVLLKAMRARYPGLRILLTHGTATGRAEGAGLLQPGDVQVWQPWDTRGAVERFFKHFKPRLGLLMETEVWPQMVSSASSHGVPMVLVNGRLSEKSLQQALGIAPLSLPAFGALAAIYAQAEEDAKRYRQLGADVAGVFGNLKFDAAPDEAQQATGKAWREALGRPVVMFASSREGEEGEFFTQVNAAIASSADALPRFLVVPRHPNRFDEVQALAESQGLRVSRRSAWANSPVDEQNATQADIWLGDSLGEMALYFAMSDVTLLGGSFASLGGQNLIEAAACGCPVVMGPHTFNFMDAAELAQAAGAARRVTDMAEGVRSSLSLLARPGAHRSAVEASLAFAAANRGAAEKTLDALQRFLKK